MNTIVTTWIVAFIGDYMGCYEFRAIVGTFDNAEIVMQQAVDNGLWSIVAMRPVSEREIGDGAISECMNHPGYNLKAPVQCECPKCSE